MTEDKQVLTRFTNVATVAFIIRPHLSYWTV